jgi:uncharacterized protein (TIGR02001 family)
MRKTLLAASIFAAFALPAVSNAQTAPAAAPEAAKSPHTITGNLGIFSEYRFRGISQTYSKPALQGGIDYSHESGFYVGNWNSNVSQGAGYPGGNIEMDFYGGWKKTWGDWGIDLGVIYYYYPGTNAGPGILGTPVNNRTGNIATGHVDNTELYIGGSWKFLSLKYNRSTGDYFSTPGTSGSGYLDLSANYDLGEGWGINGHVGHLQFKNMTNGSYTDWKLGATKDFSGWVLGASYVDTNAKGDCSTAAVNQVYCFPNSSGTTTKDAGKSTLVISVSRTF